MQRKLKDKKTVKKAKRTYLKRNEIADKAVAIRFANRNNNSNP